VHILLGFLAFKERALEDHHHCVRSAWYVTSNELQKPFAIHSNEPNLCDGFILRWSLFVAFKYTLTSISFYL
jgi:hypothetical protein